MIIVLPSTLGLPEEGELDALSPHRRDRICNQQHMTWKFDRKAILAPWLGASPRNPTRWEINEGTYGTWWIAVRAGKAELVHEFHDEEE
jgi:hypothetical protein